MSAPEISIVAPLYNEEDSLPTLVERLNKLMDTLPFTTEVVLINDGSKDKTEELLYQLTLTDSRYHGVFLARNYGHQIALSAGLSVARGTKAIMVIDGDLQDPPELITPFYDKIKEGFDIVYGVRKIRSDEGMFKKWTSHLFYRLLKKISQIDIPLDSGDFCMMSRKVVDVLNKMPEKKRFIRGMRAWIGMRQIGVTYDRAERAAGETKYTLGKMVALASNAFFSFSELPVRFMTRLGLTATAVSLIYFIYTITKKLFFGGVVSGFTGILFTVILFSGVQLITLGIIGEYILRIFFQVTDRPLFVIRDRIVEGKNSNE